MPFVISSIQWIIPVAFTFLEGYEQFTMPKYELFIHMFREQLLRATMLAVLVYFWLNVASSKVECWETFVGQEIYRLTIMDMIFGLLYSFFMEFIRKLCSLKWKSIERAEFAIARHTLELIYTQSLCWLGVFYCPLLPVVVIAKLLITFYVKRYSVVQNCRPSLKPWRASRTHTHFVGYIFIFFICMCVAVFFSILKIQPSRTCGPYQNYETSYDVISKLVSTWENNYKVFGQIVRFIFSPGFVSGFLVVLCVMVYYSRAIMQSRRSRVEQFQKQLLLEGEDKKFLLNLLNHVKVSQDYSKPGPSKPTVVQQHSHQQPQGSMNFSN
uniref:TMC domain-containing protein n=1 Tax=Arion vulgaris TaxID=1028688 RepID=A0A0B7AK54_9EUPU